MNETERFIWNVTYVNEKTLEQLEHLTDILQKLYTIPREPLTVEETYVLRETLMNLGSLADMQKGDLKALDTSSNSSLLKRLIRK